ncbi:MAG: hypothetical protein QUV07_12830 [Cyanobium sp. CZS 25K]|nr:hypothetical protein [Cyanobium sp. CZS25K]
MTFPQFRHARPSLLACLSLGIVAACPGAGAQPQASPDQTAASFNDAVRTTTEAAYSHVIPAQSPKTGQIRPADHPLVLGSLVANPTGRIVQCGDASVEVTASIVNE